MSVDIFYVFLIFKALRVCYNLVRLWSRSAGGGNWAGFGLSPQQQEAACVSLYEENEARRMLFADVTGARERERERVSLGLVTCCTCLLLATSFSIVLVTRANALQALHRECVV